MTQLAVEQRDLGGKQQVRSLIALCRLDEEERFHIAQDGQPHFHARLRIEATERWHPNFKRTLLEGDGRRLSKRTRSRHPQHRSTRVRTACGHLACRTRREEGARRSGLALLLAALLLAALLLARLSLSSREAELWLIDRAKRQQRQSRVVGLDPGQRTVEVEVEVDPDSFKEPVGDGDEANFDCDLQVLQSAQLIEQVGNLFVNFLSLSDNETQRRFEVPDRGLSTD